MTPRSSTSLSGFPALFAAGLAFAALAFSATTAFAQDGGACTKDTDCKGVNVCEGGRCVEPGKGATPVSAAITAPVTATAPPEGAAPSAPATEAAPPSSNAAATYEPHHWGTRLSIYDQLDAGIAGDGRNGSLGNSIGIELSMPLGGFLRYRPAVGFQSMDPVNGIRIDPFALSASFPIALPTNTVHLAFEPTVSLIQSEIYFDVGGTGNAAVRLSSGFDLGLIVQAGPVVVGIDPVGLDFQYLVWGPATGLTNTDFGLNWRSRFTVGFAL